MILILRRRAWRYVIRKCFRWVSKCFLGSLTAIGIIAFPGRFESRLLDADNPRDISPWGRNTQPDEY